MKNKWLTIMLVMAMTGCTLTGCSGCGKQQADEGTDSLVAMASSEVLEETVESEESGVEESVTDTEDSEESVAVSEVTETEEEESKPEESKEEVVEESTAPSVEPTPEPAPEPTPEPAPQQTTESSGSTEHVHAFVEQEEAATCDSAKAVTTICSTCGHVKETKTEGDALGHDFVTSWLYEPTCTGDGYKSVACSRCREEGEGGGVVAPLGHDFKSKVTVKPDCKTKKVTLKTCKVCGHEEKEIGDVDSDAHVWVEGYYEQWSDEEFALIKIPRIYCKICNMDKP